MSKVLQGPETQYQVIEKVALVVVLTTRRLRHYFQSFTMIVMTDLPIRKVFQKSHITGRMVNWAVELSEFDIQYEPRGPIKGHVYADFMVVLSSEDSQPNSDDFRWVPQLTREWSWGHLRRAKRVFNRANPQVCV